MKIIISKKCKRDLSKKKKRALSKDLYWKEKPG